MTVGDHERVFDPGPDPDPAAVVDGLVAAGVLGETDGGDGLYLTDEFDATRAVYADSYRDEPESVVRETVAELFGVAPVGERAESVSREELVAVLSLQSHLSDPPPLDRLALAAGVVTEVGTVSPVPASMTELEDGSWHEFTGDTSAVVTVWKRHCEPCDELKTDLDEVRSALRAVSDAPVAGVDGEACPDFCRATGVNAAPAVCCFRDGELVEAVTGRRSPSVYAELFEDVYAGDAPDVRS